MLKSRVWLEGAIVAALAMVLSFVPVKFGPGFSISLGMIPVTVYAFRRGTIPTLYAGLLWGLLHFLLGKVTFLTVPQVLIEYVFAYTAIGFAGIVSSKIQLTLKLKSKQVYWYACFGTIVGILARYIFHFMAGYIFWGDYALWGLSPVVYSLAINGTNAIMTAVVTLIAVILLLNQRPELFIPKQ
ncbi:energy-coupled thiamine transporter ThiT [Vagococcus penaei]|uniref:Energy-coupled thiamine transporter ThiT n=1 Tax=Vagococcus penaei TaxID=633807 RepID=A0A1Q2D565_9ENTE|nr:energy-coupled thiamine transporter ThiT [Vagococcus penaei]AQP53514.1 energy-coupled thiamine transporter ThiT [Vagococcus penaei]RSU07458.1 energy-coupled thiamine transporter ThiT [Vagococcus penaei]